MQAERSPGRRRVSRSLVWALAALALLLGLPPTLLLVDSAWTVSTNPAYQPEVVEVSPGVRDAPTFRVDSAAVFLNGLGLDVSLVQADVLTPSVGRYGRVYALRYASVFDADRAAEAIAEAVRLPQRPGRAERPTYLTVFTSSMGDVRGLEIIASLDQQHPEIEVVGFVVNTGPGPGKRLRVRGGDAVQRILDQSCSPFVPGTVTLGVLEVANQALQGRVVDAEGVASAYRAGTRYRGRVVVNQLCSLTRPSAITEPPTIPFSVYLDVGQPADDAIVDGTAAYRDWLDLLPSMRHRRVQGATHDNFHFRPDLFNPLLLDDILPRIRAVQPPEVTLTRAGAPSGPRASHRPTARVAR